MLIYLIEKWAKMNKVVSKEKSNFSFMKENYKKIWPFVKLYRIRALLALLIAVPVGLFDSAIAFLLKPFTDIALVEKSTESMIYFPIIIIVVSLLQSTLNYSAIYLNTWVGRKIANDVKDVLFKKLMSYDAGFFDEQSSGNIVFRFNNDVDTACNGLIANLKLFTTRLFSSVGLVCVLFYMSWQLAIVAVVFLALALFPLTTIRKKIKNIMKQTVFSSAKVITYFNETFNGNRIITSYNLSEIQSKKFGDTLKTVFKLGMKMVQRTGILSPLMHFIISVGIAGVIWLGSYLIVNQEITPGDFVAFIAALLMLYTPIKAIGNNYNAVITSLMAMERVFSLLEKEPAVLNTKNPKKLDEDIKIIEYKNVSFEYEAGKLALKNVNIKIKAGETIALVGNSGGGKTTFANLLPRFYDVTNGSITINNIDVRDIDLFELREKIAIVFQDNFLFSGTIKDNIVLGKENISEEELNIAIKSAYLDEFIKTLKDGIDTEIGERGVLLSGGQKQRIAIARAFLKNAPIVILDEATSALDNKSEAVVQEAINNLMKDRTVLVIAHRLSTVKNADKIVVINEGEIAEIGSHDDLLSKEDSIYSSLYKIQFN